MDPSLLKGSSIQVVVKESSIQVVVMSGHFCSVVGRVETFVPGVTVGQNSSLCTCFGYMDCGSGLLSLKSNSVCC